MNFLIGFLLLVDKNSDIYNLTQVINDLLTIRFHYKAVKAMIYIVKLVDIIIIIIVKYHRLLQSIISNRKFMFILKFWAFLYYFLCNKQKLSINFQP